MDDKSPSTPLLIWYKKQDKISKRKKKKSGEKCCKTNSRYSRKRDRWWTSDFTSVVTVFHLDQDDGMMIMKGFVQWNPVYGWKQSRLQLDWNLGLPDQQADAQLTELLGLLCKK